MEETPVLRMPLIKQKSTEPETGPLEPAGEIDEETYRKCLNFGSAYAKHFPNDPLSSIFRGVHWFDSYDELAEFVIKHPTPEDYERERKDD